METTDLEPKDNHFYRCNDANEKWYVLEPSPGVALLLCKFCYASLQLQILENIKRITVNER